MEKEKALVLFLLLVMPAYAESISAQGGNIIPLNVTFVRQATAWQGVVGSFQFGANMTSITINGGNITFTPFTINATLPVQGFILFSNDSAPPTTLVTGNISLLNSMVTDQEENATKTFTQLSSFTIAGNNITSVPTTYMYVNNAYQSVRFREGYFNDVSGNLVFAAELEQNQTGYNASSYDFQAILPTFSPTTYYLSFALSSSTPGPSPGPSAGAGAGGGGASKSKAPVQEPLPPPFVFPELSVQEIEEIRKLVPVVITSPDDVFVTIGERAVIPAMLLNPNDVYAGPLRAEILLPAYLQAYNSLHDSPFFYSYFGVVPAGATVKTVDMKEIAPSWFSISPYERKRIDVNFDVPLTDPQNVPAKLEVSWSTLPWNSKPVTLHLLAPEFAARNDRDGRTADLTLLINNVNKPKQKVTLEIDFNKGRTTQFSDVVSITLPENKVGLYGYKYKVLFDYDSIAVRYDGGKKEVV